MTLLPALSWWMWGVMAAVPIGIVLLYLLKLRRQPITVPSTFLWAKTVEDLHVNSLLQRLRSSPLLFLQLLAIALATAALLRPGYRDATQTDTKRVLLLDASASMSATDGDDGLTRFERAKRLISKQIDSMTDRDIAMLMTFSDRADVLQAFTSDRRKLREALAKSTATNRTSDITQALRAADGLAAGKSSGSDDDKEQPTVAPVAKTDLVVYSDGAFGESTNFDTSQLNVRYERMGTNVTKNLAVLSLSVERSERDPSKVEVFSTIGNLGTEPAESPVTLRLGDELIDASNVSLPPGDSIGLTFEIDESPLMRFQLVIDNKDDLGIDNVAFAALRPKRSRSVLLVTPGNDPLEIALMTGQAEKIADLQVVDPAYMETLPYAKRVAAVTDQLIIFDRCAPKTMPMTNTFFIGALPPKAWVAGKMERPVLLVDIDRSHPVMRYLDLFSILVAEGRPLVPPEGAIDLLTAEQGPVMAIAPREGFEDLVLGFDILSLSGDGKLSFNTDWHVQRSWPVFIYNAVRYLTGSLSDDGNLTFRPGSTIAIDEKKLNTALTMVTPDGTNVSLPSDAAGRIDIPAADRVGIYEIQQSGTVVDAFSVNLFDRIESTIASVEKVTIGDQPVMESKSRVNGRSEFWRMILIAMLAVLAIEWWYYGHRLMA